MATQDREGGEPLLHLRTHPEVGMRGGQTEGVEGYMGGQGILRGGSGFPKRMYLDLF